MYTSFYTEEFYFLVFKQAGDKAPEKGPNGLGREDGRYDRPKKTPINHCRESPSTPARPKNGGR